MNQKITRKRVINKEKVFPANIPDVVSEQKDFVD
jgi:hypothetical protein